MIELNFILKFEDVSSALKKSIEPQIIHDLNLAEIKIIPNPKNKSKFHQLIITQTGTDLLATLIKPNKNPIRYPLTPRRCYSDSLLGIVREAYDLDKHDKNVREILQRFQLRRIGMD